MIRIYSVLWIFISLSAFAQEPEQFAKTIKAKELQQHLEVIASDEYEGRATGEKGQKMAARYLMSHFQELGIPPLNIDGMHDNGYYQEFPLEIKHAGGSVSIDNTKYELFNNFYYYPGSNKHDTIFKTNEVVFLGYGIDDEKYSDYKDIDVKGKVIVVLSGEPKKKGISRITGNKTLSKWSTSWRAKLEAANKHEVLAVLTVKPDFENVLKQVKHSIESPSMNLAKDEVEPRKYPYNFNISKKMALNLFPELNMEKVRKTIGKKLKQISFTSSKVLTVDLRRKTEKKSSENVLGFIEGTDPELKNEVVVITAHYDHIGIDDGVVYNGADDDGSGTVALIELAEAFQVAKNEGFGARRSILIMPVSGEEKGLLGSQYYSENPIFPLVNTVCDLNIDMIGRLDDRHKDNPNYIYLIGSDKLSSQLHEVSEDMNNLYTKIELDYTYNDVNDPNRYYYRSDHYNFAKHGVPAIFYFNGTHEDYHKPTDTVDKIDYRKMERITRLVFYTAWEVANRDEKLKVDKVNDFQEK
jgi:hypothetical protein